MSKTVILQRKLEKAIRLTPSFHLVGSAAATGSNYPLMFFVAPYACQVVSVRGRYSAAGGSGATVTLRKAASGTAMGSGTNFWALDATATANTTYTGTLTTTANAHILAAGNAIGATTSGTLTNLADLIVTVELQPLELTDWDYVLGV